MLNGTLETRKTGNTGSSDGDSFDTGRYGNQGHAFTSVLTDAERKALIEYLKTCRGIPPLSLAAGRPAAFFLNQSGSAHGDKYRKAPGLRRSARVHRNRHLSISVDLR